LFLQRNFCAIPYYWQQGSNESNYQMAENPVFERATRFLSALRHCQVLGLQVHSASSEGLTVILAVQRENRW
jgi:hypothetical protein